MEIISLSVDEETLDKIEKIQAEASFKGRSELIRKAVENLHRETQKNQKLEGKLNAIIVTRHPHRREQKIAEIAHRFDDVLTAQLHSKLDGDNCLEVFHTNGPAERVIQLYNELEGSKNTESVNILPQNH